MNRHQNQVIPIPGSKDIEKSEDLKYRFAISALCCLTLDLSVIIEFCLRLNNFIFIPEKHLFTWSIHQEDLSSLTQLPISTSEYDKRGYLVRDERNPWWLDQGNKSFSGLKIKLFRRKQNSIITLRTKVRQRKAEIANRYFRSSRFSVSLDPGIRMT